jgi:hypothetical protein
MYKLKKGIFVARPTAAFALLLIGGILIVIFAGLYMFAKELVKDLPPEGWIPTIPELTETLGGKENMYILGLIWGILVIIGAALVYTGIPGKVKAGSIIGLIFGLLSLLFEIAGGLYIGFILVLVGAILGLTWKPS